MPKTAEEVLIGLVSTSYKLDETGVAALKEADGSFKDDTVDNLLKLDTERVAAFRADGEKLKAESYSRGKRETMEAMEKELKDEFGVKSTDAKGLALIKQIVAEKLAATGGDLTDDKIKASKLYRELEEQTQAKDKSWEEKLKAETERLTSEFNSVRDTESVLDKARTVFKGMNPILPKNEAVARNQMSLLDQFVKDHRFQVTKDADGNPTDIVPMKKDGSGRLEDSHGHAVKFDDLIKDGARKFFEFQEGERKPGAPNPNGQGSKDNTGDQGGSYAPKTMAEYAEMHATIMKSHKGPDRVQHLAALKEAGQKAGLAL